MPGCRDPAKHAQTRDEVTLAAPVVYPRPRAQVDHLLHTAIHGLADTGEPSLTEEVQAIPQRHCSWRSRAHMIPVQARRGCTQRWEWISLERPSANLGVPNQDVPVASQESEEY